ncbi:MAG: peptide deformylase [Phycisphaerae bacterium]
MFSPDQLNSLRILRYPDPRIRQPCQCVEDFDASLASLAERMFELMSRAGGVGLAAAQLGVLVRLFVCNPTGQQEDKQVYVNPRLVGLDGQVEAEEGCLCLPGVVAPIRRAERCTITASDLAGQPIERSADGLLARIWQHELDHLEGRLILERMSPASKIANRRALKQLEADYHRPIE